MLIIHPGNVPTIHSELKNSKSQPMFLSVAYRHTDNADKNASNVIKQRAIKLILNLFKELSTKRYLICLSIVEVEPKKDAINLLGTCAMAAIVKKERGFSS